MAKISFRQFFNDHPLLDSFRLSLLSAGCEHGMNLLDDNWDLTKMYSTEARKHLVESRKAAIFAVYHGRMQGLLGLKPRNKVTILISQSRDGLIAARSTSAVGFQVARGSPGKGAVQGAMELLTATRAGQSVAFMVDGPRGPIYKVKPGIIRMAEMTGLPIVPFVCHSRHSWLMKSWDKFMAGGWGGKMVHIYGDPIQVPPEVTVAQREQLREQLQDAMTDLRGKAAAFWQL